tara:strand:- start:28270 stop:28584 length:315 start_codon:yes stop_codon:yes gene_type:complete
MSKENTIYTLNKLLPLLVSVLLGERTIHEVADVTGKSAKQVDQLIGLHLGGIISKLMVIQNEVNDLQMTMSFYEDAPKDYVDQLESLLGHLSSFTVLANDNSYE